MQDELLEKLRLQLGNSLAGRLRLLRVAMGRPAGASVALLRSLLSDPDERIVRMTAREIVRRHPPDFDNMLVQLMAGAPESVRRVIGRSVGETGFDNYWNRFDRLDKNTRKTAGRAMFKLLPDSLQRLERRLRSGPVEQRLRAAAIAQDLDLAETMRSALVAMCQDSNPRLRSKAVSLLADIKSLPPDAVLDRALNDSDARVRANAIEVLEAKRRVDFVPVLAQRARSASSRERANAIKAMHRMRVGTASGQLLNMLQDERSDHRISALWALKQIGWWQMLTQVGRMAKEDGNLRVRRYALAVLKNIAESAKNKAG
jgi:HEAT repeat protein